MSVDEEPSVAALGTLSAQLLGVVALLTRELARAGVVDVPRLRGELDAFWEQELGAPELSDGERRMVEAVRRVMTTTLPKGPGDGQRD